MNSWILKGPVFKKCIFIAFKAWQLYWIWNEPGNVFKHGDKSIVEMKPSKREAKSIQNKHTLDVFILFEDSVHNEKHWSCTPAVT